jgi:hypothetical protein
MRVPFVDSRCNKRVENSKDSVLLHANLQLHELARPPVERQLCCALKSHSTLSTPLAVRPASGSASLAKLSDATTLSRRSNCLFLYWPLG